MDSRSPLRYLLLACGWTALALGFAGLFLPVLPTTPFVLLAAACFTRSSERLHRWLVDHPVFGRHVRDYLAGKGLSRRTKVVALATLWASVATSVFLLSPLVLVAFGVIAMALAVTVYIVRLPVSESAAEDLAA